MHPFYQLPGFLIEKGLKLCTPPYPFHYLDFVSDESVMHFSPLSVRHTAMVCSSALRPHDASDLSREGKS